MVFAIGSRLGPRGALIAAGLGGLLWSTDLLARPFTGDDHAVAAGIAASVIALVSRLLAGRPLCRPSR